MENDKTLKRLEKKWAKVPLGWSEAAFLVTLTAALLILWGAR